MELNFRFRSLQVRLVATLPCDTEGWILQLTTTKKNTKPLKYEVS